MVILVLESSLLTNRKKEKRGDLLMFEDVFLGAAVILFLLFTFGCIPLVLHRLLKRRERKLTLEAEEQYSPRQETKIYSSEKHTIFHALVAAMKEEEKKR